MKRSVFFVLLCLLGFYHVLIGQDLSQDEANTHIEFVIKNAGFNVDGHFDEVSIDASFDPGQLENSYFKGTVSVKSIDTGIKGRNNSLQKKEYFDEENHPSLRLVSERISRLTDGRYQFSGELTIKGTTRNVTFPFTVSESENAVTAKGDFSIDRRDYDVGGNSWIMGNEVKISMVYTGKK